MNNNFCQISKFQQEELIGRDHRIINSGYLDKKFIRNLWETISKGSIWKGELKNKAKDGSYYWVDTTIVPFLDPKDKPYQYITIQSDITQRKLAEEELIKNIDELQKINFELDSFVYSVSHDLRSPLTAVLGLVSFIEEETQEADTLQHIKMIRARINRLDEFIKNILDYSRNNRMGIQIEEIQLQKTVQSVISDLYNTREANQIRFEIDIEESKKFFSDRQSITTILENLISNAIKFSAKNKKDAYIRITGKTDTEGLKLSISDNGIGISKEYHTKVFDMFYRLSSDVTGSGIGLYIVKNVIEKLHGTITLTSDCSSGSTFTIKLKNKIHE